MEKETKKQEQQKEEYATKKDVENLQIQILQLNEACVKDSLRLTYYLDILAKQGIFSIKELEQAQAWIEAQIEQLRKEQAGKDE